MKGERDAPDLGGTIGGGLFGLNVKIKEYQKRKYKLTGLTCHSSPPRGGATLEKGQRAIPGVLVNRTTEGLTTEIRGGVEPSRLRTIKEKKSEPLWARGSKKGSEAAGRGPYGQTEGEKIGSLSTRSEVKLLGKNIIRPINGPSGWGSTGNQGKSTSSPKTPPIKRQPRRRHKRALGRGKKIQERSHRPK